MFFKKAYANPDIGSIWRFKNPTDPFKKDFRYEVLALRDGWVRFQRTDNKNTYKANLAFFYSTWEEE